MSQSKIIISKFGGTSMGDAECMNRSAEVCQQQQSSFVVVSATSGTTNLLIEMGKVAQSQKWSDVEVLFDKLQTRHRHIATDLGAPPLCLEHLLTELESILKGIFYLRDCSPRALDALVSFGERLSSELFAIALKNKSSNISVELIDARKYLLTDDQFGKARPLTEKIQQKCLALIPPMKDKKKIFVTQGFIGMTEEGQTTTLGRGGSDYSAALFAEALNADVLEIWTDVAGIATTDPRLVAKAHSIKEISFKEASELAVFGAKVLHPSTLLPAMRKNIPTFVGSSFDAKSSGTWIRKEVESHPLIRAIALRPKQALVTISTPEMLNAYGFLFQIFKIFNDHHVSIDAITTSEISVSVTIDEALLGNKLLFSELEKIADIQVESNLSIVSLIGNNINHTPGLAKKIFESIGEINVRMICLGASKHNFCFLVASPHGPDAVKKLHQHFLEK